MTNDYCDGCGWQKPIVREEQCGKKTLKWCESCYASKQKAQDALAGIVQDLTAPTERGTIRDPNQPVDTLYDIPVRYDKPQPETLWQDRPSEPPGSAITNFDKYSKPKPQTLWRARNPSTSDMRTADEQYRQLRRFFRMGFLLGAILATGIAFVFFNFIRGWG